MQSKAPQNPFITSIFDTKDRYIEKYIKALGEVRSHSNDLISLTTIIITIGIMFIVLGTVLNIQRTR